MKRLFNVAGDEQIKNGEVTDVYFTRVRKVLEDAGVDKRVAAEVRASSLPDAWPWAIFAGLDEVINLFEGVEIDILTLDEGSLFQAEEPVLVIEGRYIDFCVLETALLGLICQASGIATKAARCTIAAAGRPVYSFGARRMHPAIAPMIERNAYIGGCRGVAVVVSAKLIGQPPVGTMSHSLMLAVGDDALAWQLFDKHIPKEVNRIALIDTFNDEKFAAIKAAETLGDNLFGVRLDTPQSRRGNFPKIIEEVRWELNIRGYKDVKIFLSGGINEKTILACNKFTDAYGVGTAISNAPVVDFSLDIVEVEGRPFTKRGKKSGKKQILICPECKERSVVRYESKAICPNCGSMATPQLKHRLKNGQIVDEPKSPRLIRDYVLSQLKDKEINVED